jgi:uncharacterized low-complexity protein
MKRIIAAFALAATLSLGVAAAAHANPGPGNSFQCAPGQHDGSGSADNATDHCGPK